MGAERRTAVITKETARNTAYHEAGHAVVGVLTTSAMPIHKATIMPRGPSLGMVSMLPEGDQTSQSKRQMLAMMDVAMGGRAAEELIFGEESVTSGASNDIQQATRIARAMVTKYGFSDSVGIVYHGGEVGEEASAETRALVDGEVKKLTQGAYARAKSLLTKYADRHRLLAETLLEYETLTGDEVRDIVKKGIKPKRPVSKYQHVVLLRLEDLLVYGESIISPMIVTMYVLQLISRVASVVTHPLSKVEESAAVGRPSYLDSERVARKTRALQDREHKLILRDEESDRHKQNSDRKGRAKYIVHHSK